MRKRSGTIAYLPTKHNRDINQIAAAVIDRTLELAEGTPKRKNAAAVALGRRGGLKGGKARAAKMTPEQRRASALKAAHARWANHKINPPSS